MGKGEHDYLTSCRAIADYYLRPKLAYYAIKQDLAPITLGMKREIHEYPRDKYTRVYVDRETRVYLWASNFTLNTVEATLRIKAYDIASGEKIEQQDHGPVSLKPNQSSELVDFKLPALKNQDDPNRVVVAAYLTDHAGQEIARCLSWPDVLKSVSLPPN